MTGLRNTAAEPWSPEAFEAQLRAVATKRYHDSHPFNLRMHDGTLTPEELRRWVANRFYYQRAIPVKDAYILAKLPTAARRRQWIRRIHDHDGTEENPEAGIERWLRLGEAVGLDREALLADQGVLPGVRFAVDAYVNFCRHEPVLLAVASSLTELSAPGLMTVRIAAFEEHYPWVEADGLAYFQRRVGQGTRDGQEALAWVTEWAATRTQQEQALAALSFKCDVLWSLLDSIAAGSD